MGFEPTVPFWGYTAFREPHLKPLGQLSVSARLAMPCSSIIPLIKNNVNKLFRSLRKKIEIPSKMGYTGSSMREIPGYDIWKKHKWRKRNEENRYVDKRW